MTTVGVKIWKPVNDRIVQAARGSKDEIIGLLMGRLHDDAIIIEDSVTGESSTEPHRATLSSNALAKIADAIVTGRLKGNIVGWYHSHTEGGLFFSDTDIATQLKLQQFSSLITGMVVDAETGDVGYFRVDPQTGQAVRIPSEKITLYTEPSEVISAETKPHAPTPTIEVRRRGPGRRQPTNRVVTAIVLIGLLVSLVAVGLVLYGVQYGPKLAITHAPIPSGTIGTPIEIAVGVSAPAHNVTLVYALVGSSSSTRVLMNQVAGVVSTVSERIYGYTIPGTEVNGNIAYYIEAYDAAGNKVTTNSYYVAIADFNIVPRNSELTIYRNSTEQFTTQLDLIPINNFTQPISLAATGTPQGVQIAFSPNPLPPGTGLVLITVRADRTATSGTTSVTLLATYSPTGSQPVVRRTTLVLTVADFGLQVSPASREVSAGSTTTFNLTLTFQKGFVDPVTVNLSGLPGGAKYQLTTSNATSIGGGPGSTTMTLQIAVPTFAKRTTYSITISAAGGGILHSQIVSLIVR